MLYRWRYKNDAAVRLTETDFRRVSYEVRQNAGLYVILTERSEKIPQRKTRITQKDVDLVTCPCLTLCWLFR
jgi:hypothetical protein